MPLQWFKELTNYPVQQAKSLQLRPDNAVFVRMTDKPSVIILTCVDDILFNGNRVAALDASIGKFLTHFEGSAETLEW